MELKREDLYGAVATILVHALLLLLLLFFFLRVQPPDPPLPPGMEIDFGVSVEGSGTNNLATPTAPVVSPNPSVTPSQPVKSASEDIRTSDVGEELSKIKPTTKPTKEVTPEEKPKPVINQGALLPGKKNDGGQGSSNTPGNEGRLDGGPTGKGTQGGIGTTPGAGPSGGGTRFTLEGRSALSLPKPRYTEQEDGTVVVKVTVDRTGKVVNATTDGVRGSTTTNKSLHAEAVAAARRAQFDVKADAAPEQIGYIYYTFVRN